MSILKELFNPKNKKDVIVVGIMFMTLGAFLVFEGYAFTRVLVNPYNLDEWHTTSVMSGADYITMGNSELFTVTTDLDGYTIFAFTLHYLEDMNISVQLRAENCIIVLAVLARGSSAQESNQFRFRPDSIDLVNITDNVVELYLKDMNYPTDHSILFVKVKNMANSGMELYHKVSLLDT